MEIKLPGFIIADLYKDALVVLNEEATTQAEDTDVNTAGADAKLYFGNNTQHICIVLNSAAHEFMDTDGRQLLSNLLAALNYTLDDAAIINHHRTPAVYTQIKDMLQPRVCLLFGVDTKALQLPFIIPNYQLQRYEDCTFIQACSIDDIKSNEDKAKAEKRKLWSCLKTVFNK